MNFNSIYSKLNPSQKSAVDLIEGPVMVIAGPGTGKTQVMGARVANILSKTDASPENILCLTFTEAATVALRNRLYDFIGSAAHRVHIHTYHGFCHNFIQDNKEVFGIQELEPLSDLERIEVMREILDELPTDHKLKRLTGEVYFDLKDLEKLFNLMKKDNLSIDNIHQKIEEYIDEIGSSEEYVYKRDSKYGKKGDYNPKYYGEVEKMDKLKAASSLFSVYQEKLAQRKRYDFNDMILWVLKVFQNEPELLLQLQEQYLYFLVDEYQDTNGAQNNLLHQLIDYWDNPNVFVVGDDDQSIYKFQGANVENITEFHQRYKEHIQLVTLTENYRSSQEILDTAGAVIQHNEERLIRQIPGLSKDISASNPAVADIKGQVIVEEYANSYQEIVSLAQKIKDAHAEGVAFKDIAVLYRNHAQSEDLMEYLFSENIPYNVTRNTDILQVPMIEQLIIMLQYIDLESKEMDSGEHLLFEILHYSLFKHLNSFEIAKLTHFIERNKGGWREQITEMEENAPGIDTDAFKEIKRFISDINYWIKQYYNQTLQHLVEEVLTKCGFVSRALAGGDSIFEMQCLNSFFSFLKEETAKAPRLNLNDFLHIIDLMRSHSLPLVLKKVVHGENGVQLMTVHGSKGLEFDQVYLIGCNEKLWEKDSSRSPFNINRIIAGEPAKASEEEGRRLFYVALTRAKKRLHVSYPVLDSNDKSISKSAFVVEMEESKVPQFKRTELDDKQVFQFFKQTLATHKETFRKLTELDFVKEEIKNFRLSATNLNSYLRCPVAFFYQTIIRVPSAKNESMSFGSAIHYALEMFFREYQNSGSLPGAGLLIDRFNYFMSQHKESFTEDALERRTEYAKMVLPEYLESRRSSWETLGKFDTEINIKQVEIKGVPIRGQIDRIEWQGDGIQVIDYKTGKYSNARKKLNPPLAEDKLKEGEGDHNKIYGGDYWRQLYFYKILIDQDPKYKEEVISGILDFVEPDSDEFKTEKMVFNSTDEAIVIQQITDTFQKIQNSGFNEGCEKEDCVWCNFNTYYLRKELVSPESLKNMELDELDQR
ncbi:ATP-dependent helicase [bacterium]|nr:ATP-dependent helicase [bacterium]